MTMPDIFSFLDEHKIAYKNFEHEAVFTVEESSKLPEMPGAPTKNLFLRDKSGTKFFLVSVPHEKRVDLKLLKPILNVSKLSFASDEDLQRLLGVTPGSVTLLGLICDTSVAVEVIIDSGLWGADSVQCHPLRNTATTVITHDGLERFLKATGHEWKVIDVPSR